MSSQFSLVLEEHLAVTLHHHAMSVFALFTSLDAAGEVRKLYIVISQNGMTVPSGVPAGWGRTDKTLRVAGVSVLWFWR